MLSPSLTNAMGPISAASGETWPMQRPLVPPENLPSVIRAQSRSSPLPHRTLVGVSISLMPGPPLGPSYRMMTTSPAFTLSSMMAVMASSSLSKTRARPVNLLMLSATPAALTTAPSGREASGQDDEAAPRVIRLVDGPDDAVVFYARLRHQLSDLLPRDGLAGLVYKALFRQLLHDGVNTARLVKVFQVVGACGAHVADMRRPLGNFVEKGQGQFACLPRGRLPAGGGRCSTSRRRPCLR